MFAYYLELALRSLKRSPGLTALMVLAIGFGVAASMTTYAVFRAVSGDPIPNKSSQLFKPQIDNWGHANGRTSNDPPDQMDYTDAVALLRDHKAAKQTVMYPVGMSLVPDDPQSKPFLATGYATTSEFFSMFEVPFQYGAGWSVADDAQHVGSIVITTKINQRLFGGRNSVGKSVHLDGHSYRIVGVARGWNPQPRFYDVVNGNGFGSAPQIWIPFTRAIDLQTGTFGNNNCNSATPSGWDGWLHSECVWLSYWVELPNAAAAVGYKHYLHAYAEQQHEGGRFAWAPNVRLRNVMQWLDYRHVVPPETKVSMLLSLAFLLVCLVNTVGLLLAKFMRRAGEIGVRRALGASQRAIYAQFLAEAGMVGVAGGLLGLLLTLAGVFAVGWVFEPQVARLARIDPALVGLTLLVAIFATVVAAIYPTWRASSVQPAWQLKSN